MGEKMLNVHHRYIELNTMVSKIRPNENHPFSTCFDLKNHCRVLSKNINRKF